MLPLPTPLRLSEQLSPRRRAPRPRTLAPGSAPQALPEMPGRRRWWARCWLGVCLSLLGAGGCSGGGSEPCRLPPCGGEAPPPPCRGARCGARAGRPARSFPHTATPLRTPQGKAQPPAARGVPPEACPAGGCSSNGTRRDCQGLECRLPLRLRPRPRGPAGCAASATAEGCPEPALLRAAERAAQFAGDDFAYGGPELGGGGALGVQLACDVKPGENEVPSEDALILQLHLAKGHEKFTEMLKSQQQIIVDLQQKLAEQQHMLVSQQKEILEQQRKMYEQMDLIKVQYGMLFDTVKQMSFQSLQEDIQNYFESHLQGLQNQDRDECTESPSICGERIKCLNTPGGFRCLGIAEKDAALGLCGEEYFFNKEMQECQACLKCEDGMVAMPCSTVSDTVCSATSENKLSESWAANIILPSVKSGISQVYSGLNLKIREKLHREILSIEDTSLVFRQHGLLWTDLNFAVKHNCRNFLQLSLKLNGSEEGYELSGVRIEQPEGKYFQSTSLSSAAEVEPSQTLSVFLRSPNQFCNQSKDLHIYDLNTPLSLFWLSHDTGAVAISAQMSTAMHYQTNYRPTFKIISVSDPYMLSLSHDGRAIKFTETGVVKFVFHQALYSMGHTCVREGFSLISYINRNGTNRELMNVFKSGVNYRDTSISASGATKVAAGDLISFEILSPAQCNVRYFGDSSGISIFSLIWIPSAVSSAISATVSVTALPTGAVRNKLLDFTQVSSSEKQIQLVSSGQLAQKYFVFTEKGVASLAFNLKLIHSCNMLKVTLNRLTMDHMQPTAIAQQIGGQMPEGSIWTSVSLRASFDVHNGTLISVSLDCVRGRINQITHEHGTSISILWISS
ncbi:uncharacterized protein [Anser cygnoides]|uniref:uncharacterized protein isoform X3 n=1 Tax=Anser cygnoides TaxID=8845 RepID=UPI0034D22266